MVIQEAETILIHAYITEEGLAYCVDTITIGSTYYTTVLNPGNVDYSDYYRFTCLVCSRHVDEVGGYFRYKGIYICATGRGILFRPPSI